MKLARLHLSQLKQFRQSLDIDELQDGINLFVGPNESGKSTVVDAIRAAFFERYKSSTVDHLQPWGDSSAGPEIELEFEWRDTPWKLNKRFLKQKRCDLRIGQEHFSGDEAEEKLAELLGYQFAKRGASKAEHWGVPGLLWVEQGAVQEIHDPVEYAADHLKSALSGSLGEMTSSSGDALIAEVQRRRGALLTRTGQPTGDYRKTIERCEALQKKLEDMDEAIVTYRKQVDELGRLREKQQDIDTARPWEAQREQATKAENRLAEVRGWQEQQQRDQQTLQTCRQNQQLYRQQLRDFAAGAEQLRERTEQKEKAQTAFDDCQARKPKLEAQLIEAQNAYEQANKTFNAARQQAARSRLQKEHDQFSASVTAQAQTLEEARGLQGELDPLRERLQTRAIDEKALDQLKKVQPRLGELKIKQEAQASRLEYDLQSGKSLTVGGETISGRGERLLLDTTELVIPGVGNLRLQPGGADVAELRRQTEQLEVERDGLLQQLGIQTLEEGEQRAADNRAVREKIKEKNIRLEAQAPKGVDALATQHRLDETQLEKLAAQLAAYPEARPDVPDEQTAEAARQTGESALKAIEEAAGAHKSELGIAKQALATATDEWQKLKAELESPDRKAREKQANDKLTDFNARESQLQTGINARQEQIDSARPDALAQDIDRHTRSADAMQDEANQRQQAIDRLQIELQTLGAQGLEEQRDVLWQEAERLRRRRAELAHRAGALDLLLNVLRDKRQTLTRQLQAPLQKHLNHYLKLLFPRASLAVDENLMPATLTRNLADGDEQGDIDDLSYGSREQMGLISRLAYADLLREAGKPTLIILDDALVHSDDDRLAQMKRILYDAAQRHQVLLFSCHPQNWRDLGVTPRDLQALKASAT
jgi:DNA repair exonuclease SbcCD ATPase subunit